MWIWRKWTDLKKYHLTPPPGFAKALEEKAMQRPHEVFSVDVPELSCSLERCAKGVDRYDTASVSGQVELSGGKGISRIFKAGADSGGIATSNAKELALAALDALQIWEYFSSVRTGCEVKKGKPAPDVYLKVAEDLGVRPEECLVFEDVPKGIEAGRNAGMTVCAVDDAFSASDEKEKKEKADYFIRSYDEIQAKTYERCGV